jgi:non-ribosomal peptide synthetase component F
LSYWKQQLADVPELKLPTDRPRPPVQTFQGATQTMQFSRALAEALVALSQREGVTIFMLLLAAFKVLLHRHTGQDDIVAGTPTANRNRAEVERLIGFFVSSLVMRTDFSGNPTFLELLRRVRKVCLEAYAHQDVPFEKLVAELHPNRDLGRNPLFQVVFVFQNPLIENVRLGDLIMNSVAFERGVVRFDIEWHMWEAPEGIGGAVIYSTDLFDAATIARLAGHLQTLLEGIVANPEQRLSELPLVTEAERRQFLTGRNLRRRGKT